MKKDAEIAAAEDDLRTAQIAVASALKHLGLVGKDPDAREGGSQ